MTHLDWPGTWNARDLGALPTIRSGALLRSEQLDRMTPEGWAAAYAHGLRTVVDLRSTDETAAAPDRPPPGIAVVDVPLEDGLHADTEFRGWESSGEFGTPLYYRRFLERWPDRCAAAVAAVANAAPGAVLVHCAKGCDRTGLVVALLLTLLDVPAEHIAADYAHTARRLRHPRAAALGRPDDSAEITAVLARVGWATPEEALLHFLSTTDVPDLLHTGGLATTDVTSPRTRALT